MKEKVSLTRRFAERMLDSASEREAFLSCLESPPALLEALIWIRGEKDSSGEFVANPSAPSWLPSFVQFIEPGTRPGAGDRHRAGEYYVLDSSSIYTASTLLQAQRLANTKCNWPLVLDLCSAPGGKGIFAWRLFEPNLTVFNEVERSRYKALLSNLERCDITKSIAISMDPAPMTELFRGAVDLVIVDAPCSGQSLLVKGQSVPGCFHKTTLTKNALRQRRIIANGGELVAPGGFLAYMTCTYSEEENEGIVQWFLKKFPHYSTQPVPHLAPFQSKFTNQHCYRLWPQEGVGAGGFTVLFRNESSGERAEIPWESVRTPWRR